MNIFYLHSDPKKAAQMQCDRHVVKMILESAQMLSTAHRLLDNADNDLLYRATHKNHPSTKWVRESRHNYQWLYSHFLSLGIEYNLRYGKIHASIDKLKSILKNPPQLISDTPFSEPPLCMPSEYKQDDVVEAYRTYYKQDKASFATWKEPAVVPAWWE